MHFLSESNTRLPGFVLHWPVTLEQCNCLFVTWELLMWRWHCHAALTLVSSFNISHGRWFLWELIENDGSYVTWSGALHRKYSLHFLVRHASQLLSHWHLKIVFRTKTRVFRPHHAWGTICSRTMLQHNYANFILHNINYMFTEKRGAKCLFYDGAVLHTLTLIAR